MNGDRTYNVNTALGLYGFPTFWICLKDDGEFDGDLRTVDLLCTRHSELKVDIFVNVFDLLCNYFNLDLAKPLFTKNVA